MHELIFTMSLRISPQLIVGNLKLKYPDGKEIDYQATSGLPDWQRPEDEWSMGKGPIPAGEKYQIPTKPYWLPTRGIEGYFFHITPDPVVGPDGQIRSELGVHFDANQPGTSGCVGLITEIGWSGLCRRMKAIASLGILNLPLKVRY
jgi:hypothetical protein